MSDVMLDAYDPDATRDATLDQREIAVLEKATHTAPRDEYGSNLRRGNYGRDKRGELVIPQTFGGRRMSGATKRRMLRSSNRE